MFTGLVEEVGTVARVEERGNGRRLEIRARLVPAELAVGDSVAVDGVCLTAVEVGPSGFAVDVVPVTLERTRIGALGPGAAVNLERALAAGARLGGHWVQGHVDGIATVTAVLPEGEQVVVELELPEEVARITVPRGSITVDGVSLTVAAMPSARRVRVALVPHTRRVTNLSRLEAGDGVNVEGDVLGRYVAALLERRG
jgi:riboflavin synthase